jgi:hypothetical protein
LKDGSGLQAGACHRPRHRCSGHGRGACRRPGRYRAMPDTLANAIEHLTAVDTAPTPEAPAALLGELPLRVAAFGYCRPPDAPHHRGAKVRTRRGAARRCAFSTDHHQAPSAHRANDIPCRRSNWWNAASPDPTKFIGIGSLPWRDRPPTGW